MDPMCAGDRRWILSHGQTIHVVKQWSMVNGQTIHVANNGKYQYLRTITLSAYV